MIFVIILLIFLTIGAIKFNFLYWNKKEELNELKENIVYVMKKLKPKQNIIINYGNDKKLVFINGELQ